MPAVDAHAKQPLSDDESTVWELPASGLATMIVRC